MAALAAAAAAGAPAALPLAVLAVDPSVHFELMVQGGLVLSLEMEGCLNSLIGESE